MSVRAIVIFSAAVMLVSRAAKHLTLAAITLLLLPINVASVERTDGLPAPVSFCERNPHTCQAARELVMELQVRAVAVRELAASLPVQ